MFAFGTARLHRLLGLTTSASLECESRTRRATVAAAMAFMYGVSQVLAADLEAAFDALRGGRFGTNK